VKLYVSGIVFAHASAKILLGEHMARSLTFSKSSSCDSETRPQWGDTDCKTSSTETFPSASVSNSDRNTGLKPTLASASNDALCCEARNSLQVILSGAEILLEDHLGNLLAGQKELLSKMTENTYQLCQLLSRLLGPEEFKVDETSQQQFTPLPHAPRKI
jgi:hypothetical protein